MKMLKAERIWLYLGGPFQGDAPDILSFREPGCEEEVDTKVGSASFDRKIFSNQSQNEFIFATNLSGYLH